MTQYKVFQQNPSTKGWIEINIVTTHSPQHAVKQCYPGYDVVECEEDGKTFLLGFKGTRKEKWVRVVVENVDRLKEVTEEAGCVYHI